MLLLSTLTLVAGTIWTLCAREFRGQRRRHMFERHQTTATAFTMSAQLQVGIDLNSRRLGCSDVLYGYSQHADLLAGCEGQHNVEATRSCRPAETLALIIKGHERVLIIHTSNPRTRRGRHGLPESGLVHPCSGRVVEAARISHSGSRFNTGRVGCPPAAACWERRA